MTTTQDINDNIIAQLETAFGQTIPILPKSFLRVLAKTLAGVFILLYKYADWMTLQQFVQTASAKDTTILGVTINPLKFWGRLIGVGDPVSATQAEHTITVTVTNQTGSLLVGTQLSNADNGVTYLTATTIALDASTKSVTIRASRDQSGGNGAGVIGNLLVSDIVSFVNPIPNVARDAVVTAQTVTGADAESTNDYRQRIIDKFQKRPQGGAYADYQQWGEEVAGIVNVYPYTSDCPGQVDVYCEATVASSGSADGIPTTAQLEDVFDAIEYDDAGLASRRPAGALVNTFAITRTGFDITVSGITGVDNVAQVEDDVEAAIEEFFLSREPYIVGLAVPPRRDRITTTAVGGIVDDVVTAAGGIFSGVIVELSSVLTPVYTLGIGEKAKAATVTFT
jgi:uncharacterized phage protein gp47/JayE